MSVKEIWSYRIFSLGENAFTVERSLTIAMFLVLFGFVTRQLHRFWLRRISKLDNNRRGALETISRFAYYFILTIGFIVVLHANGIDLTTLTLLTSALGIGIGFGLQAITSNLISGIIILLERPIKIGDRIEVAEVAGDVIGISIRATTILTNDNIVMIIPNSDFITKRVINWSFNDRSVRFHIKVGVSYKSDPETVKNSLLQAARNHPGVLEFPPADVMMEEFGNSSINFSLRVWTSEYASRPGVLRSDLNFLIFESFKKNGIEIPFPQQDIYIKQLPEDSPWQKGNNSSRESV